MVHAMFDSQRTSDVGGVPSACACVPSSSVPPPASSDELVQPDATIKAPREHVVDTIHRFVDFIEKLPFMRQQRALTECCGATLRNDFEHAPTLTLAITS